MSRLIFQKNLLRPLLHNFKPLSRNLNRRVFCRFYSDIQKASIEQEAEVSTDDVRTEAQEAIKKERTAEDDLRDAMAQGDGKYLGHLSAADDVPEAPPAGQKLLRDMLLITLFCSLLGYLQMKRKEKIEKYPAEVSKELGSVKAHLRHAGEAPGLDVKNFHLAQAERSCRNALAILVNGLSEGKDNVSQEDLLTDSGIVGIHSELGLICYMQGKYKMAADHYLLLLKALSKEMGFTALELLDPCRRISECYVNLEQYKLAEHFLERAMKIASGDEQVEAQLHEQFATIYRRQGRWEQSLSSSSEAIRLAKKNLGSSHIQIAKLMNGQAHAHLQLAQAEEASIVAADALRIAELQTLPAFQDKANCLFLIGKAKKMQGSVDEALQCFTDALTLASEMKDKSREMSIFRELNATQKELLGHAPSS